MVRKVSCPAAKLGEYGGKVPWTLRVTRGGRKRHDGNFAVGGPEVPTISFAAVAAPVAKSKNPCTGFVTTPRNPLPVPISKP